MRQRHSPWQVPDALNLAVAAGVATVVTVTTMAVATRQPEARPLDAVAFVLMILASACLAWRQIAPLWVFAGVVAMVGAYLLVGYPYGPIQLCMVMAMFEAARQRSVRMSLPACVLACVVVGGAVALRLFHQVELPEVVMLGWTTTWLVLPWSLGGLINMWQAAQRRARQDIMDRAALDERIRIAREVHDVAGHALAVIAMQAGVALKVFEVQPEGARTSLAAIRMASRQALGELRAALDHNNGLRSCPDGGGEVGVGGLPALVSSVRASGLPVQLEVEHGERTPPTEIDTVVYRVVQESLTNVLRHAGRTTAEVKVSREADNLVVRVADRGRWPPNTRVRNGRGLSGMRARVESVGGTLTAGPREAGGFQVVARLPVPVEPG